MIHVEQRRLFFEICRKNNLLLAETQSSLLQQYVQMLVEWNEKINLVSRTDVDNLWLNHILHSISVLFLIELDVDISLLDIGSGGGLPGIPLAIAREDIRVTLLDSIGKKTNAMKDMVSRLGLSNISVINGRAEELGDKQGYGCRFDAVIARGVAPLHELVQWSRAVLKPASKQSVGHRSCLLAFKGGDLADEIEKARVKTGMKDISVQNIQFIGIEKTHLTGKKLVIVKFS